MSRHTRGPWKAVRECENFDGTFWILMDDNELSEYKTKPFTKIVNSDDERIVTNHDFFSFKNPNDALLISAAPDMLAALEVCEANLKLLPDNIYNKAMIDAVAAALQKARG